MFLQVAQVAAYVLGVPLSQVKVKATETMIGANSAVTGASIGTDLCAHVSTICDWLVTPLIHMHSGQDHFSSSFSKNLPNVRDKYFSWL